MSSLEEEELINTLPKDGPSLEEIKKYLDKYNDEFIVIKCGGSILIDPNLFNIFIQDVAVLKKLGLSPIIVHGGGKIINNKLSKLNIKSNFIKGLRVTDVKTINIVEDVLIEFNKEISTKKVREALLNHRGITTLDDTKINSYPTPLQTEGTNDVYVGRIRKDVSHKNGIALWIVCDNLRKGAALNAIQIAEELIERKLVKYTP